MLVDQRQGAQQKKHKVGLDKIPLDLPVVNPSRPVDDQSLRKNECTKRADDRPGHQEFSIALRRNDKAHGRREKIADESDHHGDQGMDHEQCVKTLAWVEIILDFIHDR